MCVWRGCSVEGVLGPAGGERAMGAAKIANSSVAADVHGGGWPSRSPLFFILKQQNNLQREKERVARAGRSEGVCVCVCHAVVAYQMPGYADGRSRFEGEGKKGKGGAAGRALFSFVRFQPKTN